MKAWLSSCVLVLACAIAGAGAAQNDKGTPARYSVLDSLVSWASTWGDVKREGVYTCDEWKRYAARLFKDADRNHDGYLDAKEFETIRKADPMFREADLAYFDDNRDGRISRDEFVDKPNLFFIRYDKKGTCRVTLDDIGAATDRNAGTRNR